MFSLVGVMLMIGRVSYPLESKQGSSGQGFSLLTAAFDVFEFSLLDFKIKVHFSSTAAENTQTKKNSWALCVSTAVFKSFIILVY